MWAPFPNFKPHSLSNKIYGAVNFRLTIIISCNFFSNLFGCFKIFSFSSLRCRDVMSVIFSNPPTLSHPLPLLYFHCRPLISQIYSVTSKSSINCHKKSKKQCTSLSFQNFRGTDEIWLKFIGVV